MSMDDIAEAIYRSRPRRIPWERLSEVGWKAEYRKMAEAAVKALDDVDRNCPRCAFSNAIADLVYAGDFIDTYYTGREDELTGAERELLTAARSWLADDTIFKCLEEGDDS